MKKVCIITCIVSGLLAVQNGVWLFRSFSSDIQLKDACDTLLMAIGATSTESYAMSVLKTSAPLYAGIFCLLLLILCLIYLIKFRKQERPEATKKISKITCIVSGVLAGGMFLVAVVHLIASFRSVATGIIGGAGFPTFHYLLSAELRLPAVNIGFLSLIVFVVSLICTIKCSRQQRLPQSEQ